MATAWEYEQSTDGVGKKQYNLPLFQPSSLFPVSPIGQTEQKLADSEARVTLSVMVSPRGSEHSKTGGGVGGQADKQKRSN